jgi:hypothetical protein
MAAINADRCARTDAKWKCEDEATTKRSYAAPDAVLEGQQQHVLEVLLGDLEDEDDKTERPRQDGSAASEPPADPDA